MSVLLGVDTGGTFTDAVVLDAAAERVLASAKALTTRPDLAGGVGAAIDAALETAGRGPQEVAMVSLSTTLATNALVEGQGGHVALVAIGMGEAELARAGLAEALAGDPVLMIAGGHGHAGQELAAFDRAALERWLADLPGHVGAFAVAGSFATRNPAHELAARDLIRQITGRPVTCSHELSARLNGPKRALTAVLNARLVGLISRLISACEGHLERRGISAPLMVVRGDGALVSACVARERPIETILSGPAASIAGARWLTGARDALVADIGGTTTDVALLRDGRPAIDPEGAQVGGWRTMVEAVAMRTTGLGGDSEVHLVTEGLDGGLRLGPRRLMPVALLARDWPQMVHLALDRALMSDLPVPHEGRFVLPLQDGPGGLPAREAALMQRIGDVPQPLAAVLRSRLDEAALARLVARGLVMLSGVTPSDAAHVLGLLADWDGEAADKALRLLARRRVGSGARAAADAPALARAVVAQLTAQTVDCLLEAAFAEDGDTWQGLDGPALARHPLLRAGLDRHSGLVRLVAGLGVPVVGLGASAASYYGAVGERLGTRMLLPEHGGVANAIGAVVGQVAVRAEGVVTASGAGRFLAHLPQGPQAFSDRNAAIAALEAALNEAARTRARDSGVEEPQLATSCEIFETEVEGQPMFIEARLSVSATGRPRITH